MKIKRNKAIKSKFDGLWAGPVWIIHMGKDWFFDTSDSVRKLEHL